MSNETELKLSIPELEYLRDLAFMIYPLEGEGQIVSYKEAYESISEQHKNAMARIKELKAENERLRGIKPELPCDYYPTEDLPRFGINWNGPKTPLSIPMSDGYWTPYHFAKAMIENIRGK